ncbi:MAG: chalcone isomerase family protein [Bdellovibrio sp.]|nr:chalcone isomerase family protein [Bdellovibrio sp.]
MFKVKITPKFMSVFIAAVLFFHFAPVTTWAATLKTEAGTEKFENVTLLKSTTLDQNEKDKSVMTLVSHGMRKKAVFGLVPVRVYVLQFLAAHPEKLVKTESGVLASLKAAGPIQLRLTFTRDLPGSKIADAFKDGLEANKVNVKKLSLELEQVLREIQTMEEFKKGESFSVTASWKDSQATIYLEDPKGTLKSITGPQEFAEQFLSIWFGHPSDNLLGTLKKELVK